MGTGDAERIQALTDGINKLTERLEKAGTNSNSVNISGGFKQGAWVGICITTCVATWLALIIFASMLTNLWAWKDVHNNDIGRLKADVSLLKERK